MATFREEVGRRVREAREAVGMQQGDMARLMGMTQVGYGHIERGRTLIGLDRLLDVCRVLGRPVTYFIGGGGVVEVAGLTGETQEMVGLMENLPEMERRIVLEYGRFVAEESKKRQAKA